jgi:hypothetical protein
MFYSTVIPCNRTINQIVVGAAQHSRYLGSSFRFTAGATLSQSRLSRRYKAVRDNPGPPTDNRQPQTNCCRRSLRHRSTRRRLRPSTPCRTSRRHRTRAARRTSKASGQPSTHSRTRLRPRHRTSTGGAQTSSCRTGSSTRKWPCAQYTRRPCFPNQSRATQTWGRTAMELPLPPQRR